MNPAPPSVPVAPLVLDEIYPPRRSDGNASHFPLQTHLYLECDQEYLTNFLLSITQHYKDAYKAHPEMMLNFDLGKAFHSGYIYSKGASARTLPLNYKLFQHLESKELMLFGHPSGLSYLSAMDFLPHLHWLINDPAGPHSHCACKLCPVYVNRMLANSRPILPTYSVAPLPVQLRALPLPSNPGFPSKIESNKPVAPRAEVGATIFNIQVRARRDDEAPHDRPAKKAKGADEYEKYKEKYQALKKRVFEVFSEVEQLSTLLDKSKLRIDKLKHERKFLYRKIDMMEIAHADPNVPRAPLSDSELSMHSSAASDTSMLSDVEMEDAKQQAESSSATKAMAFSSPRTNSTPATPITTIFKKSRKKIVVDPNAPKRPANAFMLFCDIERNNLKKERDLMKEAMPGSEEDAGLGNITKALGTRWKALSEDGKAKYQDLFKDEVKKYNLAMQEYKKLTGVEFIPIILKTSKAKKGAAIKSAAVAPTKISIQHSTNGESALLINPILLAPISPQTLALNTGIAPHVTVTDTTSSTPILNPAALPHVASILSHVQASDTIKPTEPKHDSPVDVVNINSPELHPGLMMQGMDLLSQASSGVTNPADHS